MGPALKCTASSGTDVKPYGGRNRYDRYIPKPGVISPSHGDIEFPALTRTLHQGSQTQITHCGGGVRCFFEIPAPYSLNSKCYILNLTLS